MTTRSSEAYAGQVLDKIRSTVVATQARNLKQTRVLIAALGAGACCETRPGPAVQASDLLKMLEDLERVSSAWCERWGG